MGLFMRIDYGSDEIKAEEVLIFLVFTGQADAVIREIIRMKEVMKISGKLGIVASDEEIQEFADKYRLVRGLQSAKETLETFERNGVTEGDFEWFCEASVLTEAVKKRLASENTMREYFVNHRSQFDVARISIALVQSESMANEIMMQVKEEGADFHVLARRFSVDKETKDSGGYVGAVTREMLPAELSAKVFSAKGGDLIGPIQEGELFQVVLVEGVTRGSLNEEVMEAIRERILEGWVSKHMEGGVRIRS
jgi:parvulin-like peptidyl-prolyl isomerase